MVVFWPPVELSLGLSRPGSAPVEASKLLRAEKAQVYDSGDTRTSEYPCSLD